MVGFTGLLAMLRHGEVRKFKSQAEVRKFNSQNKFTSSVKFASSRKNEVQKFKQARSSNSTKSLFATLRQVFDGRETHVGFSGAWALPPAVAAHLQKGLDLSQARFSAAAATL